MIQRAETGPKMKKSMPTTRLQPRQPRKGSAKYRNYALKSFITSSLNTQAQALLAFFFFYSLFLLNSLPTKGTSTFSWMN